MSTRGDARQELCEDVRTQLTLERGIEVIRQHFSQESLERMEAFIDGAERLLEVAVLVKPILPDHSAGEALTHHIQGIIVHLVATGTSPINHRSTSVLT